MRVVSVVVVSLHDVVNMNHLMKAYQPKHIVGSCNDRKRYLMS
jgi:hypothetical protein